MCSSDLVTNGYATRILYFATRSAIHQNSSNFAGVRQSRVTPAFAGMSGAFAVPCSQTTDSYSVDSRTLHP